MGIINRIAIAPRSYSYSYYSLKVTQLFSCSVASSWYDRGWHSGVELECVWGRFEVGLCLLRPKQSWQWVTFYDPWPTWPICQLTSDPRDPWPMTHDYSPVTVTVWRLRTLGKVSIRFWFHTVLCLRSAQ